MFPLGSSYRQAYFNVFKLAYIMMGFMTTFSYVWIIYSAHIHMLPSVVLPPCGPASQVALFYIYVLYAILFQSSFPIYKKP